MMEAKNPRTNSSTDLDLVVVDRISNLPDSILGVILSFLPQNEVVATSLISKRWEFLWTRHNLDFYCIGCYSEQDEAENSKFIEYVNRLLLLHGDDKLNRFSLEWRPWCIPSHVTSWIGIAVTRNVSELSLCLDTIFRESDMPISAFTCASLRSFKLTRTDIYIPDELVVCLPRLELLKLDYVRFQSEEALEKLIRGCPVLHSLYITVSFVNKLGSFSCKISSTTLRRLEICHKSCLKLKAPALEYLKVTGGLFVEESLGSLVHANFHTMLKDDHSSNKAVVKAVRAFECAKTLTLKTNVIRALSYSGLRLSTAFERLMTLEIEINDSSRPLLDFLQCSAKLEVLIIHQHSNWDRPSDWIAPLEVPVCLSFSLKKVQLICHRGSEGELKMVHYMLKNGRALEVMQISYDCWRVGGEPSKLLQKICEFPKESPTCEVQFSVWPSIEFKPLN